MVEKDQWTFLFKTSLSGKFEMWLLHPLSSPFLKCSPRVPVWDFHLLSTMSYRIKNAKTNKRYNFHMSESQHIPRRPLLVDGKYYNIGATLNMLAYYVRTLSAKTIILIV